MPVILSTKPSRAGADVHNLHRRHDASSGSSTTGGNTGYARPDEQAETEFFVNLDPANDGLPMIDIQRTNRGFRDVVSMLRDGDLGTTELPAKQYE
ncbi:hypothetical protein [Trinickia dinghuensis]|uniref:hypothetical protein n=1 Tax=Trinickia dinghuensis TaxID=2291023 RepID=UPI0011C04FAC|nr:hypothetical protein [Trinickia dinghuensis]